MKKADIFKYIALGAGAMYVIQQIKDNPRMFGSASFLKNKANETIDNFSVKTNMPPIINMVAKNATKEFIYNRLNMKDVN